MHGEKPTPVPQRTLQIPEGLARDRNRASAVSGRRLSPRAMTRPLESNINLHYIVRKGSVRASKRIQCASITYTSRVKMYW